MKVIVTQYISNQNVIFQKNGIAKIIKECKKEHKLIDELHFIIGAYHL